MREGPRPIVTVIILLLLLLLLGAVFAAIKVFLLPQQSNILREEGNISVHFCQQED